MEIIAIFVAVGLIGYMTERNQRANVFPDQQCGYCPRLIHFDFKSSVWLHDNGVQYLPVPGTDHLEHPALPKP